MWIAGEGGSSNACTLYTPSNSWILQNRLFGGFKTVDLRTHIIITFEYYLLMETSRLRHDARYPLCIICRYWLGISCFQFPPGIWLINRLRLINFASTALECSSLFSAHGCVDRFWTRSPSFDEQHTGTGTGTPAAYVIKRTLSMYFNYVMWVHDALQFINTNATALRHTPTRRLLSYVAGVNILSQFSYIIK